MVFRDLTQLMRAEAESTRLAAIVESSSDAIIGKTFDGRITSWNTAAQTLFGYSAEEAIGQPVQMLIPDDREAEEMRILTELAQGVSVPAVRHRCVRAKDGSLRQVSLTISPIRDSRRRIVGASKIVRDIAEQKRARAALRDSEARLRFTLEAAQIGDWDLDLTTGQSAARCCYDRCFGHDGLRRRWSYDSFLQPRASRRPARRRAPHRGRPWPRTATGAANAACAGPTAASLGALARQRCSTKTARPRTCSGIITRHHAAQAGRGGAPDAPSGWKRRTADPARPTA